jgi:hypothetical protein
MVESILRKTPYNTRQPASGSNSLKCSYRLRIFFILA